MLIQFLRFTPSFTNPRSGSGSGLGTAHENIKEFMYIFVVSFLLPFCPYHAEK